MSRVLKTFYLIRHGEIDTDGKRCIGTTEVPLTEFGRMQARQLGMWMTRLLMRENASYRIYSSPMERCRDTSALMTSKIPFHSDPVKVCDSLHEIYISLCRKASACSK